MTAINITSQVTIQIGDITNTLEQGTIDKIIHAITNSNTYASADDISNYITAILDSENVDRYSEMDDDEIAYDYAVFASL